MRTQYPSVLPVQITERIKNIQDIYKIANVKLTPVNKSYPLVSTESPRTEIFFPSDSVLNLDNAILEATLTFNHLGNNSTAAAPNTHYQLRYPPRYGLASLIEEINVYVNGVQASTTKRYNFIHNWIRDWMTSMEVDMNNGLNDVRDPSILYTYQSGVGRIVPKRGFPLGVTVANDANFTEATNLRHSMKYHMNLSESVGFFGENSSKIINTALWGEIKLEIIWTSQIAACILGSAPSGMVNTYVGGIPTQTAQKLLNVLKTAGTQPNTIGSGATEMNATDFNTLVRYVRRRAIIQNTTQLFVTGDTGVPETGNFRVTDDDNFGLLTAAGVGAVAPETAQYTISDIVLHIEALQFKTSDYYDVMNRLVDSGAYKFHFKRYVLQTDTATTAASRNIDYRMVVNSECLNFVLATFRPSTYLTPANAVNTLISPQGAGNAGSYQATWMSQVNAGLPFTFNQSKFFLRNGQGIKRLGWKVDENYFEPRTIQEMYIDNLRHWRNYDATEIIKPHAGLKNIYDFQNCYFTGLLSFEVKSDDDVKSVYNLRGLNTNGKAIAISCQTEGETPTITDPGGLNVDGFANITGILPVAGDIPTFVICTTCTLELQGRRNVDIKY
jgi:hypothetical protein